MNYLTFKFDLNKILYLNILNIQIYYTKILPFFLFRPIELSQDVSPKSLNFFHFVQF